MQVVRDIASLRAAVTAARVQGARVAFVPTMGALHDGHLQLLTRARSQAECVVLSIFVNPLQFGPNEDLAKYPRTETADLAAAAERGTTIAFVPTVDVMYPHDRQVTVTPGAVADRWEGAIRPGHFAGVLTVVTKLLNMVQPDIAIFGQKDLQQATLIRALVRDLDLPVTIDVAPIVRDTDGLALSSRNRYLTADERITARLLSRALASIAESFAGGAREREALRERGLHVLQRGAGVVVDYLDIVDPIALAPVTTASAADYTIVAARVGQTRLLDNHQCGLPFPVGQHES
jgi:pantoate--beta-alanine ligase